MRRIPFADQKMPDCLGNIQFDEHVMTEKTMSVSNEF